MRRVLCMMIAFSLLMCAACGKTSKKLTAKDISGDWLWEDDTSTEYYSFEKDGTGHTSGGSKVVDGFYASDITFTIEGDELRVQDRNWERVYKVKLSGDTLTLTDKDGNSKDFTRYENDT